jgi:uncharacterized protein YndB with AHSA1/START domain
MTTSPTETPTRTRINWPERYHPAKTEALAHNEIDIAAPVDTVWKALVRAEDWPAWYTNAAHIHFTSHAGPDLRDRSRFRWNTFGRRISCKVLEFEPQHRLAWIAQGIGVDAYHAWVLTPLEGGGTHVLTQEAQNGWLARLGKRFMPERTERKHQAWLEELRRWVEQSA